MQFLKHYFLIKTFKIFSVSVGSWIFATTSFAQDSLQTNRPVIFTKPTELNWRSITWPSVNYVRIPIDGGAAIYTLPSESALKFKINLVFPSNVYSLKQEERTAFGALTDLLVFGGSGNMSYDAFQNYITEHGINLKTGLTPQGQLFITADALSTDFPKVIELIANVILKPRFERNALPLWKQQATDSFRKLLDSNTPDKQMRFIDQQAIELIFGKTHYFATAIARNSPKKINAVTYDKIKEIYAKVVSKNGLNLFVSGNFNQKDIESIKKLVTKIPYKEPSITTWLPSRDVVENTMHSIRTEIVTKADMSQSLISLRYYFPKLGKLNSLEQVQFTILEEIFSATGGVVGNDRFSKALRADSGISYSPHAFFNATYLYPNTDVGMFALSFQSPNERVAEAVQIATKTWNEFIEKGVNQEELDNTRTSLMNRMLATEQTIFNKSDELMLQINKGLLPNINPIEMALSKLDKQRSLNEINAILKKLRQEAVFPVLIIMGNPPEQQIELIKKIDNIKIININKLEALTKHYF
ncbi:M16 family metallopeptidase [Spirobacillus cienkowskii]|uniref:M16 family metallopeptidase n=1 Tax=Spirobacillus cienkowskii TaxID=495820 RepID=UPI0030D477B9